MYLYYSLCHTCKIGKNFGFQPYDAVTSDLVNCEQLRQDQILYHITITALHIITALFNSS